MSLLALALALALLQAPSELVLEPYRTTGADGRELVGELGRFRVPADRARPDGPTLELAFVRFRSTNPAPLPPLVYLVGGPGPSGIEHCVGLASGRMLRMLEHCDVIGFDQRGTGLSRPNLEEGPEFAYELPLDRPLTRAAFVEAYSAAVARCVAHWKQEGVDLSAFDTRASAADVEDLRRVLGLERIQLWGESYGTHLGLAVLRDWPKNIARAVLVRVEGPDDTLKLPSTTQRHLELLAGLVAEDPAFAESVPDLVLVVRELLEALAAEPITAKAMRGGETLEIVLGPFDLEYWLANSLGLAFEFRDVPARVQRMLEGDWSELAAFALEQRRGTVGSAMALMMDCASGASSARLERLVRERADPANLLGDAVNVPYPDACAAAGSPDLGEAFRAPFRCDVPVLFVSGELDARTPPENVELLAPGFAHHVHVRVTSAGHESIEMLSAEYRALLLDFLRGQPVESQTIELPPARFRPSR